MNSFSTDKYAFVKRLLPREMTRYLAHYYDIQLRLSKFTRDEQCPLSFAAYADPAIEALMVYAQPKLEKVTGRKLCPTYSYTRVYVEGDVLKKHTDRPSCEVSATVCIKNPKGAPPNTIFVQSPHCYARSLEMDEGDACVYLGCEVEHWRDPFKAGGYTQAFLHYIDINGPHYPQLRFDGRVRLGTLKEPIE